MRRFGWNDDPVARNAAKAKGIIGSCILNKINSPGVRRWAAGG